jgi:peptidoglycan/LPS O-acetylase OafA/YrhL
VNLAGFPDLALLLFAPWFLVLGALYCMFPREPRPPGRALVDALSIVAALVAFVVAVHWGHARAGVSHGNLWPQVLATSVGYGVFLAVLGAAAAWRARWLRRRAT